MGGKFGFPLQNMSCSNSVKLVYNIVSSGSSLSVIRNYSRNERVENELTVNPEIGCICWESSLKARSRCTFYRFVHKADGNLPFCEPLRAISIDFDVPSRISMDRFIHQDEVSTPHLIEYDSRNSGQKHFALLLKPNNAIEGKQYPVIHMVYGGPGVQLVRSVWSTWPDLLKFTSMGYAVVMVDGRGSANRGLEFEAAIKYNLGTVEIEDQIEGLKEVARRTNLLDLNRVAINGWSYGGYLALLSIAKYPDVYRAAIAGGAVISWDLYDTAYTERYMGLHPSNLESSSVLNYIDRFPNHEDRVLIIHGLLDENVHMTHTQRIIDALIAAGKPHRLVIFPNEHHGVRSPTSHDFLDATILSFLYKALRP